MGKKSAGLSAFGWRHQRVERCSYGRRGRDDVLGHEIARRELEELQYFQVNRIGVRNIVPRSIRCGSPLAIRLFYGLELFCVKPLARRIFVPINRPNKFNEPA